MIDNDEDNLGYLAVIKKTVPRYFGLGRGFNPLPLHLPLFGNKVDRGFSSFDDPDEDKEVSYFVPMHQAFYANNLEQVLQNCKFEAWVQRSSRFPMEVLVKAIHRDEDRLRLIPDWYADQYYPASYFRYLPRNQELELEQEYDTLVHGVYPHGVPRGIADNWGPLEQKILIDHPNMLDILSKLTVQNPKQFSCDFLIRSDSLVLQDDDFKVYSNDNLHMLAEDLQQYHNYIFRF